MFPAKKIKDELVQWIADYFNSNGASETKAVIGISGGKDSSIVAALCKEALGRDRVFGVLMPQGAQADIDVAYGLCETLGIPYIVINIGNIVQALYQEIEKNNMDLNQVALFNTPARIRMTTLYAVSAMVGGRVANTCNLSEDWVGYSTKYGDSAGDFSPLSNLTVTEVKAVGKELGLPSQFIDKVPIDGLCGKSDEDNLGFTYNILDRYIREGICDDEQLRQKIDFMHKSNLHKLKPMPSYHPDKTELK